MRKSNYDKSPATSVQGELWKGWDAITAHLKEHCQLDYNKKRHIVVVECYQGVYHPELLGEFFRLSDVFVDTRQLFKSVAEIEKMTQAYLTDDRLFGKMAPLTYDDFFNRDEVESLKAQLNSLSGLIVIYGHGAAHIIEKPDTLVYVDMARWEIQQRFRKGMVAGLGVENYVVAPSLHYKRGYFIDWNVCDDLKRKIIPNVDFWVDTHIKDEPKMIAGSTLLYGLFQTAHSPFRVVPFFDPAPWGGQWMKEVCGLDKEKENYGWCFDCVPEENSLYLNVSGELFEMPSNNLVFAQSRALLGGPVEARFGQEFPIRFDFLDTIGGGNLSLQVHPTTQYIRDTFGLTYTQDESYYLLDADDQATVYLGLKTGVDSEKMLADLTEAQELGTIFDADKYVNKWSAKKHDHYLIPAGTIHCSGAGAMVLEISATPSIFTFKLWDWARLGLDGLPRPINIKHGANVIQWERQTEFVERELVNHIEPIAEGDGWKEERTGLHENEFIETRRHWFTKEVKHHTGGGVNVLNLIEGAEAIIESPIGAFQPFVVHYAETFIIPASVGEYTIRPYGEGENQMCGTIKAYVRFK